MALRWCSPVDADDVAQEVLVRLLRLPARPENPSAWIYIVSRRVWNRMRLRNLTRAEAETLFEPFRARTAGSPDLLLDVDSVLSRLPPRDRRILTMVFEGVKSPDIANELGCHVRDVGQMVARARNKARRLLATTPNFHV